MSSAHIRQLLKELQEEIHKTELDDDTRALVRQLDTDIHEVLAADSDASQSDNVVTRAKELEASFATEHPAAERFMREVIDTLVRMGI